MTDTKPSLLDAGQLAEHLELPPWQFERARESGLIPAPDIDGRRWSAEVAEGLTSRLDEITATVAGPPIGARRSAERLAARTGIERVDAEDVRTLVQRGRLSTTGHFKGHALYAPADLDTVEVDALADVVAERRSWMAASLDPWQAAEHLGWSHRDFLRLAEHHGLTPGPLGRYARDAVDALGGDEAAVVERCLGPEQAAEHLGIRRTDWEYVIAAGWIALVDVATMPVGRYREVEVPLYRLGDVEALLDLPGVDWEEVRAVEACAPSPLRDYACLAPTRAEIIRGFVADLGRRHRVEAWARYDGGADRWELDWDVHPDGTPTVAEVRADLEANPAVAAYAEGITLSTAAGEAVRWARQMLEPGAAVILDAETTSLDGVVIEIAVIDAATGATLLDTLVDAAGAPISPGAAAVHGIGSADLDGAPGWPEILPVLRRVTDDRQILAYNADFDRARIRDTCTWHGLNAGPLSDPLRWGCVMDHRSDHARTYRRLALEGGHRALDDCHAALDVLRVLTAPLSARPAVTPPGRWNPR